MINLYHPFPMSTGSTSGAVGTGFFHRLRGQLAILEEAHMAFDYYNGNIAANITRRFINGIPDQRVRMIADIYTVSPILGQQRHTLPLSLLKEGSLHYFWVKCFRIPVFHQANYIQDTQMQLSYHDHFSYSVSKLWNALPRTANQNRLGFEKGVYTDVKTH